jgi:hypothetical protein
VGWHLSVFPPKMRWTGRTSPAFCLFFLQRCVGQGGQVLPSVCFSSKDASDREDKSCLCNTCIKLDLINQAKIDKSINVLLSC